MVSRDDHERHGPVDVPVRIAGAPLPDASSPGRPPAPPPPARPLPAVVPAPSVHELLEDARASGELAERQRILGLLAAAIGAEHRPHVRFGLQVAWSLVAGELHPALR